MKSVLGSELSLARFIGMYVYHKALQATLFCLVFQFHQV